MKEMMLRIPNPLICPHCGLESQSERISLPSLLPFFQLIFDLPVNRRRPVSASLCQNEISSTPKKSGQTLQHPGLTLSRECIPAVIRTCARTVILTNDIDVHYLELYIPSYESLPVRQDFVIHGHLCVSPVASQMMTDAILSLKQPTGWNVS